MSKKFIVLGCGGVGKTFLEMVLMMKFQPVGFTKHIIIIEPRDLTDEPTIVNLVKHKYRVEIVQLSVTKNNVKQILDKYVSRGDILIDASYNVSYQPLINHCLTVSAHYINTSLERWEMKGEEDLDSDYHNRVLHTMHNSVIDLHRSYKITKNKLSTIIVTHGMNPGLITHFTCMALTNIADRIFKIAKELKIKNKMIDTLTAACANKNYALMAYVMSLKTVHCSERDTQISKLPRPKNTFQNTWGPYSFYSEGVDPVQLGWGTHESSTYQPFIKRKILVNTPKHGEQNQIFPHVRGVDLLLKSYVPYVSNGKLTSKKGDIIGMAISHSENDTANRYLSLYEDNQLIYRPSNYYVYAPCKSAWDSIDDVKKNKYQMLNNQLALRQYNIKSGEDAVGSLLLFSHDPINKILYNDLNNKVTSFWSGTILSLEQTKKLKFKYAGPTTVQVGISLITAIKWMLANPDKGLCFPEDLPHEKIINESAKYLGTIFMDFVPYSPKTTSLESFLV